MSGYIKAFTIAATTFCASSVFAISPTQATRADKFQTPLGWTRGATLNSTYALWDNSFNHSTANPFAGSPLGDQQWNNSNDNNILWNGIPDGQSGSNYREANIVAQYSNGNFLSGWNVQPVEFNGEKRVIIDPGPPPVIETTTGLTRNTTTNASQRIYGGVAAGGNPLLVDLTVPNYGLGAAYSTTFVLQLDTSAVRIEPSHISIGIEGGPFATYIPISTSELFSSGSGAGFRSSSVFVYELPGNADSYTFRITSPDSGPNFQHVALAALSIDTFAAVPEPTSVGLLIVSSVGLGFWHYRRRRRTHGV